MNFLCIHLGEKKRGGGGALMHVYVWEHIVSLYCRTAQWMCTKLGRDGLLMVPYKCCCFSARSVQGQSVVVFRPDPSRGSSKAGQKWVTVGGGGGVPFFKELLVQQTECMAMI